MEKEKNEWEKILEKEGMPEEPPKIFPGKRVELGDGLGRKTESEEKEEDGDSEHSKMCPLNLKESMNNSVDQPNDKPIEKKYENKKTNE